MGRHVEQPRITIIGVGGAGCNLLDHLVLNSLGVVRLIATNTDATALERSLPSIKIQLGETGLGAGASAKAGRRAAKASRRKLRKALIGADLLFIVAGLGGGTGTGASPVIARTARKLGILTIGLTFMPFSFEQRDDTARKGLKRFVEEADAVITVDNDLGLQECGEDSDFKHLFRHLDDRMHSVLLGLVEGMTVPSLVNLDFDDFARLFKSAGQMTVRWARAAGPNRTQQVESMLRGPGTDLSRIVRRANRVLFTIATSAPMAMHEIKDIYRSVTAHCSPEAAFIKYATVTNLGLGDYLELTIFATVG